MKRRLIIIFVSLAIFLGLTMGMWRIAVQKVTEYAQKENDEKAVLVQERLDETLQLLEELSVDEYITNMEIPFLDKAEFLTNKNVDEKHGYMMLRILDEDINIYKEGVGIASNLGTRDYMQEMYDTGERQVTDAFLAGADGTTINYTVTVPIQKDGKVVAALMAAIYGSEIDELLGSDKAVNVLVGSQLQYMGGISAENFGLAVAQVLENENTTSRPVEEILIDFHEKKSGSFWGLGDKIQFFTFSPIENSEWVVMTEVRTIPIVKNWVIVYACIVVVLIVVTAVLLQKTKVKKEETLEETE